MGVCPVVVHVDSENGIASSEFAKFGGVWWLPWAKTRLALAKTRLALAKTRSDVGQLSYDLTGVTGLRSLLCFSLRLNSIMVRSL
jgi:hypothetical protein